MTDPDAPLQMLVVDDDDVDREKVCRLLARTPLAVDVTEASSGAQALQLIKQQMFDCVVLDNQLGDWDGAELLPRLHQEASRDCPIIMVTGAGNEALAVRLMLEGAADYLAKTQLSSEALARSIQRCIEHHRLQSELDAMHSELEQRVEQQAATIRQRERDLRALIDNAPTVMGYWDREQRCRFGNQTHREWFGVDPQQLQGQHLREVLGPVLYAASLPAIEGALAGEPQLSEHQVAPASQQPARHAQVQWRPDRAEDGEVLGFYATMTDVTPIKQAQAHAEELLRFNTAVIENSAIGIAVFRPDGSCVLANAAFAEVCGEGIDTLRRSGFGQSVAWRPHGLAAEAQHTLADGMARRCDTVLRRPDGREVHLACAMARVDRGGEPHLLLIARDTTEQRLAHDALVTARDEAESAARTKSAFLANMSHEIRTPMNAIIGLSRLALEDALPTGAREYIDKVHTSAVALMGILDDVLDYSKIEAGLMHFERIRFELEEVLQRVADLFQARIEQKGLSLSIDLSPHAPRVVLGDPLRLSQVLTNLVGNAVKFTERGHIRLTIERCEANDGGPSMLAFSIIDTGIGIHPDQRAALFEAFVQGDGSITRRFGGTGLGLAICKRVVEAMGGRIGVNSGPHQGSEFWFTAQLAAAEDAPAPAGLGEIAAQRVLVIDGNGATRGMLTRQLQAWQMVVDAVADLPSALERVGRAQQDGQALRALVVDAQALRTAGAAGVDAARRLRERAAGPAGPPPALLTMVSVGERDTFNRSSQEPLADALLVKPVLPSRLLGALTRTLHPQVNPPAAALNAQANGSEEAVRARAEALRTLAAPLAGLHVLVAEDNPLNQIVAEELLRRLGLIVTVVEDGALAVQAVQAAPARFAAVLMDMHMPVLDGLEATRRLLALPAAAGLPVIGMTAAALAEDRARCLDAGMVDHIPKPVMPDHLVAVLLKWLIPLKRPKLPAQPEDAATSAQRRSEAPRTDDEIDLPSLRARLRGNDALLWRLLQIFADRETGAAAALADMWAQGDTDGLRRKVHDLKGSAATLGAVSVSAASAALEQSLREGHDAGAALARLQRVLSATLDTLRAMLASRPGSS